MATARRKTPATGKVPAARKASATKPAPATSTMSAVRKVPTKTKERPQDPLVFSGPPGRLRADLTVANTGDGRLAVRGLTVLRKGSPDLDVQAAVLVPPGATASMQVTLPVEPGTRPGDYPAEVEVAGVRRVAVLRVETVLSMSITPRRLLAEPGMQDVSIVAVNEGNVDLPLASVSKARTSDGGKEPGPDVTLTLTAPAVLAAATTITLHGQLEVPASLEPARRHTASVPVGLADLEVIILPRKPQRRQTS